MGLLGKAFKVVGGAVQGYASGGIGGAVAGAVGGLSKDNQNAQAQQVAQNNPALGNALNGSGGKVMMEIPVDKVGQVAQYVATA